MNSRLTLLITLLIILIIACGCRKELLNGDFKGIISSYDQYLYAATDQSGVEIQLLIDSSFYSHSVTDESGRFSFGDLPHGKYAVILKREGYVMPYNTGALNHIGGGVPFYSNYSIYEIPRFSFQLDSVGETGPEGDKIIYLRIDKEVILRSKPYFLPQFIIFASGSPDVSKNKFTARGKGFLRADDSPNTTNQVNGIIRYGMEEISRIMKDYEYVYITIYPIANGQGYGITQYFDESLGPSSNVIKCKWPK